MWTFYSATGQRLQTSATVLATQAEMETGTALTSFVTPGRTQYHPGVAKFWALVDQTDQSITASYNVASIADGGVGNTDFTIGTDFSSANWSCVASSNYGDNYVTSFAAGTIRCGSRTEGASPANVDVATLAVAGFGDQ